MEESIGNGQPVYPGDVIKTSDGTGPYEVISVSGSCTCPSYQDTINNCNNPSLAHYHITCKGGFYLNGYRNDNGIIRNVWQPEDRIIIISRNEKAQLELF